MTKVTVYLRENSGYGAAKHEYMDVTSYRFDCDDGLVIHSEQGLAEYEADEFLEMDVNNEEPTELDPS